MQGRASFIALLFACALFGGAWWTQARASAADVASPPPSPTVEVGEVRFVKGKVKRRAPRR